MLAFPMRVPARYQRVSSIFLAALLLTWPAVLNHYPLLFPDSIGYLHDGRPLAAALLFHPLAGFTTQRSELYSLGILPFHGNLTPWGIVALNALLAACVLWLTVRSILPRRTMRSFLAITAFLSLFTSASWYVSLFMPDILGALLYLSLYLLLFAREALSKPEIWFLTALSLWAISAHATHLMLAAGICLLLAMLLALRWPPIAGRGQSLTHIAALVALAAAAQAGLHAYLYGHPSLSGNHPPYLMARIIADGPGRLYLEQNCPTPAPPAAAWAICAHVADLPDNDDDFLWDPAGIWSSADRPTQQRLLAEELPLVRATLRAYPGPQFTRSWANFTQQLNDFGVNDFDDNLWMRTALPTVLPHPPYARSLQASNAVPSTRFTLIQRWVVLPSALLLLALLPTLIQRHRNRLLGLAAVVVLTLIANALVTAVLSSSDSRYQARVIWLLPLVAVLALLDLYTPHDATDPSNSSPPHLVGHSL